MSPVFPSLTLQQADALAAMPLRNLLREYPHHLTHALNNAADVATPRQLHPVFYGCYDWHSAVHGYWLLARCAQAWPELPQQNEIVERFDEHFTEIKLRTECAYFDTPGRLAFERPYGYAWIFALSQALADWREPSAGRWHAALEPLVCALRARMMHYLDALTYPIRAGTHANSAFAIQLALEFARRRRDYAFEAALLAAARRFFAEDRDYPAHYEPGGDEFLSPALIEALLMSTVFEDEAFSIWLAHFLPARQNLKRLLTPATVGDRSDPKLAHLDGLNLSRAWCMRHIAARLPANARLRHDFERAAGLHLQASLPYLNSGHDAGEHWLATFAWLALT